MTFVIVLLWLTDGQDQDFDVGAEQIKPNFPARGI
jgi:hypothetical protein